MDFFVYDNIHTYERMHPSRQLNPETDLKITDVAITPWNSFWIKTDFDREEHNVNINQPYVHLHKGVKNTNAMKFDIDPHFIPMNSIEYDSKRRQVVIWKPSSSRFNPWRKPLKIKNVRHNYYGQTLPKKNQKAVEMRYDMTVKQVHIILNYYGGIKNSFPKED